MRSGIPRARTLTIDSTGRFVQFDAISEWIKLRTDQPIKLFFTEADFLAGTNGFPVAAADGLQDFLLEDRGVWIKADAATATIPLLVSHRKG